MLAYEHYLYATMAVLGTALAVWVLALALRHEGLMRRLTPYHGIVGPFVNIMGVLFGLTLAFIGNDTWSARDRAMDAVFREADGLRALSVLARDLPEPLDTDVAAKLSAYGAALVAEWPSLRWRATDPAVADAGDALLAEVARRAVAQAAGVNLQETLLAKVMEIRGDHDVRVSLSRTHMNPMKWLGMAFLGLLTLISVVAVHLHRPRAGTLALVLFATAAAPSAAIVLVQGNPFQPPAAVSPAPIVEALSHHP